MYTEYGKFIKKLLIDRDSSIKELSEELKVTSAYVSSVLSGKKEIPCCRNKNIIQIYNLNNDEKMLLYISYCKTSKKIDISIDNLYDKQIECILEFKKTAEQFCEIDDYELLNSFINEITNYRIKLELKREEVYKNAYKGTF